MRSKASPVRVMLVDDTFHFRVRMAALLSVLPGVEVVGQSEDVPAGIILFEELQPDVVILDISLPGPSGIQLLEFIKQQRPATVVIMLTNYNVQQLRDRCFELGADYYFSKSEEFERTLDVCELLAERRIHSQSTAHRSSIESESLKPKPSIDSPDGHSIPD